MIQRALQCLENRLHYGTEQLNNTQVVSSYLRLHFADEVNEVFAVLFLDNRNCLLAFEKMFYGNRTYVPLRNRAQNKPDFSKISNEYILVSLQLQRVFGLRREESMKMRPHMADKGDKLELQPSWCKGGRGRTIPILTDEQRHWIDQAKILANKYGNSLIPKNKNYKQQKSVYDKQVMRAGLRNLHGLRHAYAQRRYKELTGWEAPINGGPKFKSLTIVQKNIDHQARMILTEELGHGRKQIIVNYCG